MTDPALFLSQSLFLFLFLFFTYTLINTYTYTYTYSFAYSYPFPTLYLVGREDWRRVQKHYTRSILVECSCNVFSLPKVEAYE